MVSISSTRSWNWKRRLRGDKRNAIKIIYDCSVTVHLSLFPNPDLNIPKCALLDVYQIFTSNNNYTTDLSIFFNHFYSLASNRLISNGFHVFSLWKWGIVGVYWNITEFNTLYLWFVLTKKRLCMENEWTVNTRIRHFSATIFKIMKRTKTWTRTFILRWGLAD